jgi:hypothetical protein
MRRWPNPNGIPSGSHNQSASPIPSGPNSSRAANSDTDSPSIMPVAADSR